MSTLVVVGYDDQFKAEEVRLMLLKLQRDYLIDMEDAVARSRKDEGRELTLPLFRTDTHSCVERMVRISSLSAPDGRKDLSAIITTDAPPPSIMTPKVVGPFENRVSMSWIFSAWAARRGQCFLLMSVGFYAVPKFPFGVDTVDGRPLPSI